jgi:hypothetical protein
VPASAGNQKPPFCAESLAQEHSVEAIAAPVCLGAASWLDRRAYGDDDDRYNCARERAEQRILAKIKTRIRCTDPGPLNASRSAPDP